MTFPKARSLVFATNDGRALSKFRSIITPAFEVLSLADIALLEPIQDGRSMRQSAMIAAALISSQARLPTVAFARSFTIDPLFEDDPDPQTIPTSDYPTYTWRISSRERTADLTRAVMAANQSLLQGGYCGPDDRCAYLLTTLCFMMPEGEPHFIEEWCKGQFYLDTGLTTATAIDFASCLVPAGQTETLAKLDRETRARVSDFQKAVRALKDWLSQQE